MCNARTFQLLGGERVQGPDQRPRNQPGAEMMVAWTRSVAMGKERSGPAWERLRKQNQDDLVVDCL